MGNKNFIHIEDLLDMDDDSDDNIVDNIDSNFYYILQKCLKNEGCKDLLPLIAEIDKHNIKNASMVIATMYLSGIYDVKYNRCGLDRDEKKAVYWGKKVFDNFGVIEIGEVLASVYVQIKQYKDAYSVYQTLSTINNHIALTALGNFHRKGLYVEKDLNKALKYYQKAFKYGNLSAPLHIAKIYFLKGKFKKSFKLYLKTLKLRYKEVKKNPNSDLFREK